MEPEGLLPCLQKPTQSLSYGYYYYYYYYYYYFLSEIAFYLSNFHILI
jgi:hypothetical protein